MAAKTTKAKTKPAAKAKAKPAASTRTPRGNGATPDLRSLERLLQRTRELHDRLVEHAEQARLRAADMATLLGEVEVRAAELVEDTGGRIEQRAGRIAEGIVTALEELDGMTAESRPRRARARTRATAPRTRTAAASRARRPRARA